MSRTFENIWPFASASRWCEGGRLMVGYWCRRCVPGSATGGGSRAGGVAGAGGGLSMAGMTGCDDTDEDGICDDEDWICNLDDLSVVCKLAPPECPEGTVLKERMSATPSGA